MSSLTYHVCTTDASGKQTTTELEVGTDTGLPPKDRWDVLILDEIWPLELERIVDDVNRHGPKAVGIHGPRTLKAPHISCVARLENLLDVTLDEIGDDALLALSQHEQLKTLTVGFADRVTDAGMAAFRSLKKLRQLQFLVSGKITDKGFQHLAECTELEILSLGENPRVTAKGAHVLLGLPKLRVVTFLSRYLSRKSLYPLERKTRAVREERQARERAALTAPAHGELAPAVMREIERLGGKLRDATTYPAEFAHAPLPIRRLLFDIQWPEGQAYETGPADDIWLDQVEFGRETWDPRRFDAFPCCEGRPFVLLGITQDDNYAVAIPLDREFPADPVVHVLNCDQATQLDYDLHDSIPLSEVLAELSPTAE